MSATPSQSIQQYEDARLFIAYDPLFGGKHNLPHRESSDVLLLLNQSKIKFQDEIRKAIRGRNGHRSDFFISEDAVFERLIVFLKKHLYTDTVESRSFFGQKSFEWIDRILGLRNGRGLEIPELSMSIKLQRKVLDLLQAIIERICFSFLKEVVPLQLREHAIHEVASFKICTKWRVIFFDENSRHLDHLLYFLEKISSFDKNILGSWLHEAVNIRDNATRRNPILVAYLRNATQTTIELENLLNQQALEQAEIQEMDLLVQIREKTKEWETWCESLDEVTLSKVIEDPVATRPGDAYSKVVQERFDRKQAQSDKFIHFIDEVAAGRAPCSVFPDPRAKIKKRKRTEDSDLEEKDGHESQKARTNGEFRPSAEVLCEPPRHSLFSLKSGHVLKRRLSCSRSKTKYLLVFVDGRVDLY